MLANVLAAAGFKSTEARNPEPEVQVPAEATPVPEWAVEVSIPSAEAGGVRPTQVLPRTSKSTEGRHNSGGPLSFPINIPSLKSFLRVKTLRSLLSLRVSKLTWRYHAVCYQH